LVPAATGCQMLATRSVPPRTSSPPVRTRSYGWRIHGPKPWPGASRGRTQGVATAKTGGRGRIIS
jgi:hypothetical protein